MKIKLSTLAVLTSIALIGCTSYPPLYEQDTTNKSGLPCDFEGIASSEFMLTGNTYEIGAKARPVLIESVRGNPQYWSALKTERLKFTGRAFRKDYPNREENTTKIIIDDEPYIYQADEYSEIVTESCQMYYLDRDINSPSDLTNFFTTIEGTTIYDIEDYKSFLGEKNLLKHEVNQPKIVIDKFTKTLTIKGDRYNGVFLRTWANTDTKKLVEDTIQIYADVLFLSDWGHLDQAHDQDGNKRELMYIDTDVDCSSSYTCRLTETVGITVPISYLQDHKDGFELQVSGTRSAVLKITSYQIKQMLNGLTSYRNDET